MKKLTIYILLAFVGWSCGTEKNPEPIQESFFGESTNNIPTSPAFFTRSNIDYKVDRGSGFRVLEIEVDGGSVVDIDREIKIKINNTLSTATSNMYSIISTNLKISRGQSKGTIVIMGNFENLPKSDTVTLVLELEEVENSEINPNKAQVTIRIYRSCPIISSTDFTGNYLIEHKFLGYFGGIEETIVTLSQGDTSTERVFVANVYPNAGTFPRTFKVNLVCDEVEFTTLNTGLACTGDPNLVLDAPVTNGAYDRNNDSEFIINYTDNSLSGCGLEPIQASIKLIKQ